MKRLDVNDPNVFDKWRDLYYDLTEAENIEFGYDMEAKYPHQKSFDEQALCSLFETLPTGNRVVEVGGWKGELAACISSKYPERIYSWHNIDMCKAAIEKSVPQSNLRYMPIFPFKFDWFTEERTIEYDVFVSAHTIEHLTGSHVIQLLNWANGIPNIFLEAPIAESGQANWQGYQGTHILECGWDVIDLYMAAAGYSLKKINETVRAYRR